MPYRPNHLRKALRVLVRRNATLHERLYEAAGEFAAALREQEKWPDNLVQQAGRIRKALTAKGRIVDTIGAMDASVAGDVAEELADFVMAVDAAKVRRVETGRQGVVPQSKRRPATRVSRRPFASQ